MSGDVNRWIGAGEFDRVVEFYEERVETEPEEICHARYLQLAYLLAGRQEEARALAMEGAEIEAVILEDEREDLPLHLFLATLAGVFEYPSPEAIAFFRASLARFPGEAIETHLEKRVDSIARKNYPFAIEILKSFLEIQPDRLWCHQQLSMYFTTLKDYRSAIDHALKMREIAGEASPGTRAFIESHIVFQHLWGADWGNIEPLVRRYKQTLESALEAGECPRMGDRETLRGNAPLVYLEDNLAETRSFYNRTGELFQAATRERFGRSRQPGIARKVAREKLRIGYIAHTLSYHTIGLIARWLMCYHDRQRFYLGLYLVDQPEDDITKIWFRANSDVCHNLPEDASAIAERIEADHIDILVDLDSITGQTTCQVMALKPAPVQVTWLGFDATGIPAVDYFLADAYVLPENAQQYYRETIWRLPGCYIAVDGVEVGPPSLRREDLQLPDDSIAYLTVQAGFKRDPEHIRLQMQVPREVPNSYLLVQGSGDDRAIRDLFSDIAREEGVNPDRLRFLPSYPTEVYRANLQVADVVLDTYPFTGGMTTLDVLWMGIPLVTKVGQQWASRNSYTLMTNAGISEGIAWNDAEYIEWGIRFGTDERLRRKVVAKLEASRRVSPIWNAKQFTRNVEDAYRQMWANYLEK